jgi:hypothetical protein
LFWLSWQGNGFVGDGGEEKVCWRRIEGLLEEKRRFVGGELKIC